MNISSLKLFSSHLLKIIIEKSVELWEFLHSNFPVYADWVAEVFGSVSQIAAKSWQKITEVRL